MFQPDASTHALQSPSLVLVAPMPRRPIALVARRHHHQHHPNASSHSRSRSSRNVSSAGVNAPLHSPDAASDSAQRKTSPLQSGLPLSSAQATSMVRLVSHPYSRAKTPSNAVAHPASVSPAATALASANGWSLGLGISPVSPPPRSRAASRDEMAARPLSRLSCRESTSLSSSMVFAANEASVDSIREKSGHDAAHGGDEAMLTSPITSPPARSCLTMMDVERTPTKSDARRHSTASHHHSSSVRSASRGRADDDQEPRSTPTIGATSPRPDDLGLTLSPVSPTQQRITAAASASVQLPLSFPSPKPSSTEEAKLGSPHRAEAHIASVSSLAPSPCLSDSQSRSPSASPSPCPSPSFGNLLDTEPSKYVRQPRKMGLPLPPVPTSPIPRKMTRNPFERSFSIDAAPFVGAASSSSCATLQARLAHAMANSGSKGSRSLTTTTTTTTRSVSVVDALEGSVEQPDEEMDTLECVSAAAYAASPSPSLLHRHALVSVDSNTSVGSRMDLED